MSDDSKVELLELAAKAYGFLNWTVIGNCLHIETGSQRGASGFLWNPFDNDGDALRLAVKLNIKIDIFPWGANAGLWNTDLDLGNYQSTALHPDHYSATRYAIVKAAAELGRQNK